MLLTGRPTVINLEGFDDKLAQRTMDFISGSVYAINGRLHRISSCIFIISPDTVDISGDYLDMIKKITLILRLLILNFSKDNYG